jgi:hypothetical protein
MTEVVEVELEDGEIILAEVSLTGGDVGTWDRFKMDAVRSAIGKMGRWARDSVLRDLLDPPQKVSIEFGIKLAVKSGELVNILAESSGEATITVAMEWTTKE